MTRKEPCIHYITLLLQVENGIYSDDKLIKSGLGGITLYFNGAIGGLMAEASVGGQGFKYSPGIN